jgi:hypothetical protein
VRGPGIPDRRSVLLGAALTAGLAAAGCSAGGRRLGATPSARPTPLGHTTPPADVAALVDGGLRSRAVTGQRRLLAAAAAPAGVEPFATIRTLHLEHLQRLTGSAAKAPAAAAHAPAAAQLAADQRAAAVELRGECLHASPGLAPLLASLAASSEVAAMLLAP